MSRPGAKVLVAMSGGVDSSVAAALLQRDGYQVIGCFMRLGSPGESLDDGLHAVNAPACDGSAVQVRHQGCCSIGDAKDAQHVAAQLGIGFYVLNFKREFGRIIDYFVEEYNAGRTPNPCVRCNDWLKFGRLAAYARTLDADYVATGHYARVERIDGEPALLAGVDREKDQSYVLFGARRAELERVLLPVGRYRKQDIRRLAAEFGLPVHDKPDSQEICFVPSNNYMDVVGPRSGDAVKPGRLVDLAGNDLGAHAGHQHFTIGQRRGVGVALGYPVYVVDKDAERNTVTIGPRQALERRELLADQTNWLCEVPTEAPIACRVKIRYNAAPVGAKVRASGEGQVRVWFDEPQPAVAPGQAVVCYADDRVLGGGWIRQAR